MRTMNQKDRQMRRNNTRRLFEHTSGIHVNCIRINSGNTIIHELAKFLYCESLAFGGYEFITEAVLENRRGRADIVNLDLGEIIELVHTEREKSIEDKAMVYPLPIIKIDAQKYVDERLKRMKENGTLKV
jgi:hypothetical protein